MEIHATVIKTAVATKIQFARTWLKYAPPTNYCLPLPLSYAHHSPSNITEGGKEGRRGNLLFDREKKYFPHNRIDTYCTSPWLENMHNFTQCWREEGVDLIFFEVEKNKDAHHRASNRRQHICARYFINSSTLHLLYIRTYAHLEHQPPHEP